MDLKPYQSRLEALGKLKLNLDLDRREEFTEQNGWRLDHYEADLPDETPGEPLENASFKMAQAVLRDYRFPPPDLITGIFVPDTPLEKRVMLLRARFLIFTFYFGVRINGVTDELRQTEIGQERVWGYRYATLEGHFERGQIEFLIAKNLLTGTVEFRIAAFSQTGTIRNPFYRLGFSLFGRGLQRRFAQQSLKRMQQLVTAELQHGTKAGSAPTVAPASSEPGAQDKLEELGAAQPSALSQSAKPEESMGAAQRPEAHPVSSAAPRPQPTRRSS
jgi:Domain of unknown function (DUF1990)